jgi:hypothetical protein
MTFSAFRYASGITTATAEDPRLVQTAMVARNVLGVIRTIEASTQGAAVLIAKDRFASGNFELTVAGRRAAKRLLGGHVP